MLKVDHDSVKEIIRDVAQAEIMTRFRALKKEDIAFKIGDDPVTIADKEAEKALSARLSALLPGSKVLGEEAFATNPALLDLFSGESPVWIIDPIDGTRNFVDGKTVFGVIVALAERNQTVAGWLYDPNSDEFVSAEKGAGAYHGDKRLKVLHADRLENMFGSFGSRITKEYKKLVVPENIKKIEFETPMMCACHEYARLVVGFPHFSRPNKQWHYHSWLEYCTPWDDAAGILIHSEAGGFSAHWDKTEFKPSSLGKGLLETPDKDSWQEFRNWVASFCKVDI